VHVGVLLAIAIGVGLGYLGSIPAAGPLAMLIAASALDGDRPRALRLALGGAVAEGIWAAIALLGVQQLIAAYPRALIGLQIVSAIVLIVLGASMLRPRERKNEQPASSAHVLLGFVLVATNPGFLVAWTGFAALLASFHRVAYVGAIVAGAVVGIVLWFATLYAIVARVRFTAVDRAKRVLGVLVIGFALAIVFRLLFR